MVGLATVLGSGAMTNSIAEIGDADTILVVGSNTTSAHPIIALQIKAAVRRGAKLIVINPKEIELCRKADTFIQNPPGSDVPLLMAIMRIIVEEGLADKAFIEERCENFEAFRESLETFVPEEVAQKTGISLETLRKVALTYAGNGNSTILYCMGITQHVHGTDNVLALANLALLTGNIGKANCGINPLRGQNNVQGSCDMGSLPDVFPGYKKVDKHSELFEKYWDTQLSSEFGRTHTEIFDDLHDGTIKAVYLVGENPVLSEANAHHAIEAMERANFMVVQDIFFSETAQLADVILPATSFAEKDGTFTNTERRIQRVRKAIEPVGDSKPDWWITQQIALRLQAKGFDYESPEDIMAEIAATVPTYAGVTYPRIERTGIQWPCTDTEHKGTPFLHKERFSTESGKARFTPLGYREVTEAVNIDYPLTLTTTRSLFHFHSTMTRRVFGLNVLDKGEVLIIHPHDAKTLDIVDGEEVYVSSRRGKLKVAVQINTICIPGTVSMSFHFSETPTNQLTSGELDPVSKIPGTKLCAVKIEKI